MLPVRHPASTGRQAAFSGHLHRDTSHRGTEPVGHLLPSGVLLYNEYPDPITS